jgi:DNA repair exonuclease SbcCD nuclease subunit
MGKIVIASDFHLKFSAAFDRVLENGTPSRLQEIIDSVDWVIKVGKEHHAESFISSGDTFDVAERLHTREGLAIAELFKRVKSAFPRNYWLIGNHDMISSNHNILDLFNPIINIFSKPSFIDTQDARLFFLPYLRETTDIYLAFTEFEKKYDCPGKKYFFGHFWDTKTISVDPDAVDLSKINLNFFDRVFTGHFHVPTTDLNAKVVYLGTLLNKKFNETGKKGCWILDTDKNSLEFIENPYSPEFITTIDTNLMLNLETLNSNAYYRVYTSPENVIEITKLLGSTKGFELLTKNNEENETQISILNIEKRNSSSLKEYILNNAGLYLPEGVSLEEFKTVGEHFMVNL